MKKFALISATILSLTYTGTAYADVSTGNLETTVSLSADQHGPRRRHQERGSRRTGPGAGMAMLQAADTNGDNSVTREEINALQAAEFDYRDRNGDGYLDREDLSPMAQQMRQRREERMAERTEDGEGREFHARRRQVDTNEDGRISREEFLSRQTPMFDRLDTNDDDVISPEELDAAVESRREQGEARFWWRG